MADKNTQLNDMDIDVEVKTQGADIKKKIDAVVSDASVSTDIPTTTEETAAEMPAAQSQSEPAQPAQPAESAQPEEAPQDQTTDQSQPESPETEEPSEEDADDPNRRVEEDEETGEDESENPDEKTEKGDETESDETGDETGEGTEGGEDGEGTSESGESGGDASGENGEGSGKSKPKSPKGEPQADAAEDAAKAAKKAKDAEKAAKVAKDAQAAGNAAKVAAGGSTCWIVALVIVGLVLIIVIIVAIISCTHAAQGGLGKASPMPAGKDSVQVKNLLAASREGVKNPDGKDIAGFSKFTLNDEDKKFIEEGKIDKRLAELLKYLSDKHTRLEISHVVSGYTASAKDNTEGGSASNDQVVANVSAHAIGNAADISKIDFVYKAVEKNEWCKNIVAAICGPAAGFCKAAADQVQLGDLVFISDEGKETGQGEMESLDIDDILADIELERMAMDMAQQTIDQTKQDIESLAEKMEQAKVVIELKKQNVNLTPEQRALLDAQISKIENLINMVKAYKDKINQINEQFSKFNTTYTELQDNLVKLKENLKKAQEIAQKAGVANDELNNAVASVNKTLDSILAEMKRFSNQTATIANTIKKASDTLSAQIANIESVVNQSSEDMNAYIDRISKSTEVMTATVDTSAVDSLLNSLPSLEAFKNTIQDLAQKMAEAALEAFINEAKERLEKAVQDELNKALGSVGLGFLGDDSLLRLPCMGFVPPGMTGTNNTGISNDLGQTTIDKLNLGGSIRIGLVSMNIFDIVKKFIPEELLVYAVIPNTEYLGNKNTQAIPIKVKWQDPKPDVVHVSPEQDDTTFMNPLIFYTVYQPEARRKVHQALGQMLQFPYDKNDLYYYRVNQIITYSHERDIQPFWDTLKKMYGLPRPANIGLFAMPESWAQIHVGY